MTLAPAAEAGAWVVIPSEGGTSERFGSLSEAAAQVSALGAEVTLCLPSAICVVQRVALPSGDAAEVREMALLQVEKLLPFGLEAGEVAISPVWTDAESSEVAALAASHEQLEAVAAPLTERRCWPVRVLGNAQRLAGRAPKQGTALLFFEEHGEPCLVLIENGIATFTQPLLGRDGESVAAEIPGVLLSAELAGVRLPATTVLLDERWSSLQAQLGTITDAPVELVNFEQQPAGELGGDLQPASWKEAVASTANRQKVQRALLIAAACYLALLAIGWVYAGVLRYQIAVLDGKTNLRTPKVAEVTGIRQKWTTLAPAIDQRLYLLEMLMQVCESRPSRDLYITAFDQSSREILIQGEAPSPLIAADLNERLKARPELAGLKFQPEPPQLLANGRARFRISVSLL
ncbi:MAG: hypothetical protein JSR82_06830 [Verrucomicrobia bacterium]|nr:hypothetical protein [Verrucomicrobiota bacterium]